MRRNNIGVIREEVEGLKKLVYFSLALGSASLAAGVVALILLLG